MLVTSIYLTLVVHEYLLNSRDVASTGRIPDRARRVSLSSAGRHGCPLRVGHSLRRIKTLNPRWIGRTKPSCPSCSRQRTAGRRGGLATERDEACLVQREASKRGEGADGTGLSVGKGQERGKMQDDQPQGWNFKQWPGSTDVLPRMIKICLNFTVCPYIATHTTKHAPG
jgi:hypothetical protein